MLIIDGHNLIPKVPGLSLRDIDDEESLAALLQQYARLKRKQIVVFFDGAPPGQAGERVYGIVRAHYVPAGRTADDAIHQYLGALGKAARSATVVSSDRLVQANARALHARVLSSEDFARALSSLRAGQSGPGATLPGKQRTPPAAPPPAASPGDMNVWIDLFGLDPERIDRPIDLSSKPAKHPAPGKQRSPSQPRPEKKKKRRPYHGFPPKES
jgi:predicted RNA-binding protein with PIN domain